MIFLDRDGTIVKDYPDAYWANVNTPEFLPGVIECLRALQCQGFSLSVVTNQYLIGEGIITEEQYHSFTQQMVDTLRLYGVEFYSIRCCPHSRSILCRCAKPKTGMVEDILREFPEIDLTQSLMVGDSVSDVECALAIGIRAYSIGLRLPGSIYLDSLPELLKNI